MNWKKLAFITIVTIYGFGFSTVFGYTPLTETQVKEIGTTLQNQLDQKIITKDELKTLNQELIKIRDKVKEYQTKKDRDAMDKAELYFYVFGIGATNMKLLFKFYAPDFVKQWPYNPSDPNIVEDINKIEAEINDILKKDSANTNNL